MFKQRQPAQDPLKQRELFAVSLRKEKRKQIVNAKRKRLYENVFSDVQEIEMQYLGYWHSAQDQFYAYCQEILPELDL